MRIIEITSWTLAVIKENALYIELRFPVTVTILSADDPSEMWILDPDCKKFGALNAEKFCLCIHKANTYLFSKLSHELSFFTDYTSNFLHKHICDVKIYK